MPSDPRRRGRQGEAPPRGSFGQRSPAATVTKRFKWTHDHRFAREYELFLTSRSRPGDEWCFSGGLNGDLTPLAADCQMTT